MAIVRYIGIEGTEHCAACEAGQIVANGGIIIYPTETLYGIGADCTNGAAVRRINRIKRRNENTPQIVLIRWEWLQDYVAEYEKLSPFLNAFSPGPLTIITNTVADKLPETLTPGGKLAFRISSSWFVQDMLNFLGRGITSTSVNIAGDDSLSEPERIIETFWDSVDGIYVFPKAMLVGPPSTIVDASMFPPSYEIVRRGAISEKAIMRAVEIAVNDAG